MMTVIKSNKNTSKGPLSLAMPSVPIPIKKNISIHCILAIKEMKILNKYGK